MHVVQSVCLCVSGRGGAKDAERGRKRVEGGSQDCWSLSRK